jgi:hypothetical protein
VYQKQDGTAGASYEMYCDTLQIIDWADKPGENGNGEHSNEG